MVVFSYVIESEGFLYFVQLLQNLLAFVSCLYNSCTTSHCSPASETNNLCTAICVSENDFQFLFLSFGENFRTCSDFSKLLENFAHLSSPPNAFPSLPSHFPSKKDQDYPLNFKAPYKFNLL